MQAYMEQRGYSWMFEAPTTDDDEDDQRPLLEELEIDLDDIFAKVRWALRPPKDGMGQLSDFWGPVGAQLLYAALVVWGQLSVVSWILSIWLVGSAVVFFLARVLGADVTFSHTLSSLGYCVLPLSISRCLMLLTGSEGPVSLIIRGVCTAWATYSASMWLSTKDLERKQALLVYPIALYMIYFTLLATGV